MSETAKDDQQSKADAQLQRSRWPAALETLSPIWFALVMNTGILSLLLHDLPYQFSGAPVLSTILFVFALALLVVITFLQLLRIFMYPSSVLAQTKSSSEQLCLWGCAPIALLTVTSQVAATVSMASWGGHAFTIVAYVMWWVATFMMVSTSLILYISFAELQVGKELELPTAIFIPAVGTVTDALIGAIITTYSYDMSSRLAVPVIVTSYILLGYGMFIGISIYAVFLHSLLVKGFYLPPSKWPGLLLLTGPMGQSAAAIQFLAMASRKHFGNYVKGTFLIQEATSSIISYSTVLGLIFLGFDLFWLFVALYAILKGTFRRQISFSMTWWSTIFPTATIATTCFALSEELDSPAFRVLTTGLFLILLIDFFLCWIFTIRDIIRGKILDGRELLAEMHKQNSKQDKEA